MDKTLGWSSIFTILEINNEITIDLKISGEGIRMKDGRIDLDHWVENN